MEFILIHIADPSPVGFVTMFNQILEKKNVTVWFNTVKKITSYFRQTKINCINYSPKTFMNLQSNWGERPGTQHGFTEKMGITRFITIRLKPWPQLHSTFRDYSENHKKL